MKKVQRNCAKSNGYFALGFRDWEFLPIDSPRVVVLLLASWTKEYMKQIKSLKFSIAVGCVHCDVSEICESTDDCTCNECNSCHCTEAGTSNWACTEIGCPQNCDVWETVKDTTGDGRTTCDCQCSADQDESCTSNDCMCRLFSICTSISVNQSEVG